ncbi:hypothetical protein GCM10023093_14640 [Nemorincola caseinilytica]|uniref:DUF3298 domain-containing protein n=1 Tax=Nemorincola caseinilytica TaxID=2054315 RepID=A0ABP8NBI3_9BACT
MNIKTLLLPACLYLALAFASCGSNTGSSNNGTATSATTTDTTGRSQGAWYRHYEGTIAGQPVSADIYHTQQHIHGTYAYHRQDIPLALFQQHDSSRGDRIFLYESVLTDRNENDDPTGDHWVISFTGNAITGKWISRDGKKNYDIQLRETYDGAYRFALLQHTDSTIITLKSKPHTAISSYDLSIPASGNSAADNAFLTECILKKQGCNAADLRSCLKDRDAAYFKEYMADFDSSAIDDDMTFELDHERSVASRVVYSRSGVVVLCYSHYAFSGGAHGMGYDTYLCIDVPGKKVFALPDVLQADTPVLLSLIEAEVRRQFRIPQGQPLIERLATESITTLPHEFSFTSTGIIFHYAPYDIASYADGEVDLFISFTKLRSLLLPAFVKRMNIQ